MKWRNRIFPYIGIFAFVLIVWGVMIHRMRLGMDFTDETAYLTWAYRFSLGDRILLDTSEELQSIGSLFIAPALKGFRFINGGYDGVIYCFRMMYFLSTIALYLVIVYSLNCRNKAVYYYLFTLPVTIAAVANLYQFSYNTLSLNLAYAAIWCLFPIRDMDGNGKALAALSGCLMALSSIIYPSFSVLFIAMGIVHYHILRKDQQQKAVCFIRIYTAFAAFVVCLFLLWLLSSSEWDIRGMKAGIHAMLKQLQLKQAPTLMQKLRFALLEIRKAANSHIAVYVLCFVAVSECIGRKQNQLRLYLLLVLYVSVLLDFKLSGASYFIVYASMFCSELYVFLRWAHIEEKEHIVNGVILPGFLIIILRFITSDNQSILMQIQTGFVLIAPLYPLCFPEQNERLSGNVCVLGMMTAILCLSISFHSFYREEEYGSLDTEVEDGIYKHLYTTGKRHAVIGRIQEELKNYIRPQEGMTMLAANHFVPVYMISGMRPVTPDIWDAMGTNRGNKSSEPLLAYMERTGREPDYILFEDYEGNMYWYDDPAYSFNLYISDNYELIYESEEIHNGYRTAIFRKSP